jgi:hypothetical protein
MSTARRLGGLAAALALVVACDSGGTECVCPSTGLTATLPASLAGEVLAIQTSGAACATVTVEPSADAAAFASAAVLHLAPTQPGPCHLELDFRDGTTFATDVTVVETTGCCAGLHTSPIGAAQIDVPSPPDASP